MEFSKFIEKDIIDFLEGKVQKHRDHISQARVEEEQIFSVKRDYSADTRKALEAGDLDRAKHLYQELKKKYWSSRNEEKDKLYAILHEVNELIKAYYDKIPQGSLHDQVKEFELQTSAQQSAVVYDVVVSLQQSYDEARRCVEQKDSLGASAAYASLKKHYALLPDDDLASKKEWYEKLFEVHAAIKELHDRKDQFIPSADAILSAKECIKRAIDRFSTGDIHGAENSTIDARHALSKISDAQMREKLSSVLDQLVHKIQFEKQHAPGRSDELVREAQKALDAGERDLALRLLRIASTTYPQDEVVRKMLAEVTNGH